MVEDVAVAVESDGEGDGSVHDDQDVTEAVVCQADPDDVDGPAVN